MNGAACRHARCIRENQPPSPGKSKRQRWGYESITSRSSHILPHAVRGRERGQIFVPTHHDLTVLGARGYPTATWCQGVCNTDQPLITIGICQPAASLLTLLTHYCTADDSMVKLQVLLGPTQERISDTNALKTPPWPKTHILI